MYYILTNPISTNLMLQLPKIILFQNQTAFVLINATTKTRNTFLETKFTKTHALVPNINSLKARNRLRTKVAASKHSNRGVRNAKSKRKHRSGPVPETRTEIYSEQERRVVRLRSRHSSVNCVTFIQPCFTTSNVLKFSSCFDAARCRRV